MIICPGTEVLNFHQMYTIKMFIFSIMTLVIILVCILALVLLIAWGKFNPFLAFLIVSIGAGIWLGIPIDKIARSVENGIGETMKTLVTIIGLGAMLGKLVAESGAAQRSPWC